MHWWHRSGRCATPSSIRALEGALFIDSLSVVKNRFFRRLSGLRVKNNIFFIAIHLNNA